MAKATIGTAARVVERGSRSESIVPAGSGRALPAAGTTGSGRPRIVITHEEHVVIDLRCWPRFFGLSRGCFSGRASWSGYSARTHRGGWMGSSVRKGVSGSPCFTIRN